MMRNRGEDGAQCGDQTSPDAPQLVADEDGDVDSQYAG